MKKMWILLFLIKHRGGNPETPEEFVKHALHYGHQWMFHATSGREGATKPLYNSPGIYVIPDTWSDQEAADFISLTGWSSHAVEFTDEEYYAFISAINAGQVGNPA